jgi:hypothetical protein
VYRRVERWKVGRQRAKDVSEYLNPHSPHAELVHLGLADDVSAGVEQGRHAGGIEGRVVLLTILASYKTRNKGDARKATL